MHGARSFARPSSVEEVEVEEEEAEGEAEGLVLLVLVLVLLVPHSGRVATLDFAISAKTFTAD